MHALIENFVGNYLGGYAASPLKASVSYWQLMVLLRRIELPTPSLPMTCSTTELQQHAHERGTCYRVTLVNATKAFVGG